MQSTRRTISAKTASMEHRHSQTVPNITEHAPEIGKYKSKNVQFLDKGERTTLCSNNSAVLEGTEQQFEVWLLEQALCWSLWVGRIGDDNIKLILVIIQEFESISNMSFDFWVLVTDCHPGKVLLGETDHGLQSSLAMSHRRSIPITYLINIAQDSLLDALMLDNLTQDASITATNDQNLLWIRMRIHSQMSDHLLVCELVSLGALNDIVKNQNGAIVSGFEDQDVLVFALFVVEDILDLQCHSLTRPHVGNLAEPAIYKIKCVSHLVGRWEYRVQSAVKCRKKASIAAAKSGGERIQIDGDIHCRMIFAACKGHRSRTMR
jgi:hypothetical protein